MISSRFQAILARSNQRLCHLPIQVEMRYDQADPLAFSMLFLDAADDEIKPWTVSRDLLVDAMNCSVITGEGDVRFLRDRRGSHLIVCIKSPEGHADIKFPLQQVEEFLEMSEYEAAEAVVILPDLVDEAIRGILGGR